MFSRNNHGWIGVDIGASSLKLAQVVRQSGSLRLVEAAIVPRQDSRPITADLPQSSADEMQAALVSAPRCTGRSAAALLPVAACEFNTALEVDSSEANQVASIAEELATLGVDLHGRVFDYWPGLPPIRGSRSKQNKVNILSVNSSWSDRLTSDLVDSSLDCRKIDGLPFALVRAVAEVDHSSSRCLAAIDWGSSGAMFVLIDNGQPIYVRKLKKNSFAEAKAKIEVELGLDLRESSDLLQSVDLSANRLPGDEVSAVVAELLAPSIDALTLEIERTLEYVQSAGQQFSPKKIYLLGGGATVGGIAPLLTERLRHQVEVWQLDAESEAMAQSRSLSTCQLGPAIALSALRWEETQ